MKKAKNLISTLVVNKFFWQLLLAVFMIGTAIFFIRNEHVELLQIREKLEQSLPLYVLLGIALTIGYLLLQAKMYVHCFLSLGKKVPVMVALRLFLKRNFISVFLPAGGFSSLAFFTGEIEEREVSKSQIHLASTIFGFVGILSVVVVAIPIMAFAVFAYQLQSAELWGFGFLLLLSFCFVIFIFSVAKKGKAYHWLGRIRPSMKILLDEMIEQQINRKQLWLVLLTSIIIEFIGIFHLYIAMLALGFEPSWPAAIIGYIVMVMLLIASPFLRGLGAIEVSLTFILGQFGFDLLAAVAITLLYRFFEFWLPLVIGMFSFISKKDNLLLRILPAFIIFILGLVNIISAITPALPARLRLMKGLIPEELLATSNALVMVFGLILVILSFFLFKGSKRAWILGVSLTLFSAFGHLLKGADYEEASLAFIALAILLYTRRFYKLKPHPKFTRISFLALLYSLVALLSFGVISLYFINKRHFGIDFELWASIKSIFKLFFLFDSSGLEPQTAFARHFLTTMYISGGAVLAFIFSSLLRPYISTPYNSEEEKVLAQQLVEKYGNSALDYFKTYADKFFFFASDRDGFISFKITRHFAFVLENPVCKDEVAMEVLISEFDSFCEANGFISVFYRVPQNSLEVYKNLNKKSLPIGEEAVVELTDFKLEGGKMKTTRSAINRLTSEGFGIKIYTPPIKEGLLQKLEQVSDNWLEELGQKEIAFTQGIFDAGILKNQTIITVEDQEEKVYAFLNLIPDYVPGEATYDLIRKVGDAPNGVLDMLMAKTFLYLKEQGFRGVNIGLAPLSGIEGINLTEKSIKYAYENLRPFDHFKGLRKYKDKFGPRWEKKYLIYTHSYHLLQVPNALKRVSEGN
ncbi:lysylphosphatidylglycerol synthetase family protein [Christiangramia fulva]|uniref:Phosphatidylglycerol lysyltransferase n=1 Tax=Christiangramia fulva TaxID=2126553 RepID=A0A2R3Z4D3_9FLAO|nr:phosphatidylglycerol lysyltransferase domain-containing protein [Christiangramia fulva]AVR45119.1 lysylphosphatidylglycerol synthetase family protein [Christiangramia fulva]